MAGSRYGPGRSAFTFMAEVYWDLEWTLQQQGFDYCYDKRLYDREQSSDLRSIRDHLRAGLDYQDKLARFLENHDEPRAESTFQWPKHRAAAAITFLSPGLRFFHQGQFEGARVRVPVHLGRGPSEPTDQEAAALYGKLLLLLKDTDAFRNGDWSQIDPLPAWPGNFSSDGFVSYAWAGEDEVRYVVAINYADNQGQCYLRLPFPELEGRQLLLTDLMGGEVHYREGRDLVLRGLYVDQAPWEINVFELRTVGAAA
jgi:glycosidase